MNDPLTDDEVRDLLNGVKNQIDSKKQRKKKHRTQKAYTGVPHKNKYEPPMPDAIILEARLNSDGRYSIDYTE